jgi:hypothetical protein
MRQRKRGERGVLNRQRSSYKLLSPLEIKTARQLDTTIGKDADGRLWVQGRGKHFLNPAEVLALDSRQRRTAIEQSRAATKARFGSNSSADSHLAILEQELRLKLAELCLEKGAVEQAVRNVEKVVRSGRRDEAVQLLIRKLLSCAEDEHQHGNIDRAIKHLHYALRCCKAAHEERFEKRRSADVETTNGFQSLDRDQIQQRK